MNINDRVKNTGFNEDENHGLGTIIGLESKSPLNYRYIVLWDNPVDENRASVLPETCLEVVFTNVKSEWEIFLERENSI